VLALRSWHRDRGAVLGERRGAERPLSYGDPAAELEVLRTGCGLIDRSDSGRLELLGEDRGRFLNGLLTVDVAGLEAGEGAYGFATDAKGRILSDVTVLVHDQRLWLETAGGREGVLAEHLLRYRVADRVEVQPLGELLPITLAGGGLEAVLAAAGVDLPPRGERRHGHGRRSLLGREVHLAWSDRVGVRALVVRASMADAGALADDLVEQLGASPVGDDACEVLRLEAGIPLFGVDFDDANLPGEVGTLGTVDWKKGCYLGQEIVARMHYRGQPARALRRLRSAGEALPEPGAAVSFEGRAAGEVSSAVRSPRDGVLALAMLQRRAAEAGTDVEVAGCGVAVVERLPMSE
jgi:folate-binding protein YgfZ